MRKASVDKEIKAVNSHKNDSMFNRYEKIDSDEIREAVNRYRVLLVEPEVLPKPLTIDPKNGGDEEIRTPDVYVANSPSIFHHINNNQN